MLSQLVNRVAAHYPHLDQRALKLALWAYPLLMLTSALAVAIADGTHRADALIGIALGTCGGFTLMNLLWLLAERGAQRRLSRLAVRS